MEYKDLVKLYTPKENRLYNAIIAFLSGGIVGFLSDALVVKYDVDFMLIFWIVLAGIFTGIGVFDDLVDKFKMGIIIPITGFSHSVVSSSLEYKKEGFITGIGSNYFKLAGSVVLYGVVSSAILSFIGGLL